MGNLSQYREGWRILWVWPGYDERVADELTEMWVDVRKYVAHTEQRVSRHTKRKEPKDVLAFPGYLFTDMDGTPHQREKVLEIDGAGEFVCFAGGGDFIFPDECLQQLDRIQAAHAFEPRKDMPGRFAKDDRVRVLEGPFTGFSGLIESENRATAKAWIEMLGGLVLTEFKSEDLELEKSA